MAALSVRATALINRYEFIRVHHGQEGLERVLSKLTPSDAEALKLPTAEWYPLEVVVRVDRAMVSELFGGDISRVAEVGSFALLNNLTLIYRFFFRVLNTETMLENGVKAFRKSVSQGVPTFEHHGPRDVTVRFEDFPHGTESYCHFLKGAISGVMAACGAKRASVEKSSCSLGGSAACAYRVRWS